MFSESGVLGAKAVDSNSSTGSRLLMYQAGLREVLENPSWLGLGHAEHMRRLKQHLQEHSPELVDVIGHYHNDALNAWVEFGWVGLLAYLITPLALIAMGLRLFWREEQASAVVLWSLCASYAMTGLSNTNMAHNYFPVTVSLSVSLVLLGLHARNRCKPLGHDAQMPR
jgi:O-antigen ligase